MRASPTSSLIDHTHLAADSCSSRSDKRAAVHGSLSRGRPLITSRYFYPILSPYPCHVSGPTPFLVVQKPRQNLLNKISQLFAAIFVCKDLSGVFCLEGFCPFPLLSEYIRYNRTLNITFNFRFHMFKKYVKVWCHLLLTPHLRAWRTLWTAPKWKALGALSRSVTTEFDDYHGL